MKRLLLTTIITLVATFFAATTMLAQTGSNESTLTPNQWKRGIAIVGQHAALDGRFGRPDNEFPINYSLDDLDKTYKTQKWRDIYNDLKPREDKPGTMQQLRDIAKKYTQPGGVERKLADYIAAHTEKTAPASPSQTPAATQNANTPLPDAQSAQLQQQPDSVAIINASADENSATNHSGMSLGIDIVLLLLSAAALYLAWAARRENAELKKELEYKTRKLKSQFDTFSKNITTDLNRVTYKVNKRRISDSGENVISFNDDNAADAANEPIDDVQQPPIEPHRYFLSQPDENGLFTQFSTAIQPEQSIYELTTYDGLTGTFHVINTPKVHQYALLMPEERLMRACTGNAINNANGKTRIANRRDGTARFENGKWHVAVKAIIQYEA
ncbi:MAG: hypothetical protein ACI308_10515 [Muribaculaceae bacterium]